MSVHSVSDIVLKIPRMHKYLRCLLYSKATPEDIEDVLQESLCRALEVAPSLPDLSEERFTAWLLTLTKHTAWQWLEERWSGWKRCQSIDDYMHLCYPADQCLHLELKQVAGKISLIPQSQCEVLLEACDGADIHELCGKFKVNEGSIRKRLKKG